ncbi:hypothetical protein PGTUg99_030506 [Puccinia graminis f. sp. tritici]|uniref:Uncharacterized protein n=1 Tax=Puccinia graminis f. sp. tritici TaxID=56615 RepID=A0A5B0RWL8_PUCGR|nr:hypothetical protein PGTUg99_030506 [Puccinia graminis f. sp. tritici]
MYIAQAPLALSIVHTKVYLSLSLSFFYIIFCDHQVYLSPPDRAAIHQLQIIIIIIIIFFPLTSHFFLLPDYLCTYLPDKSNQPTDDLLQISISHQLLSQASFSVRLLRQIVQL